MPGALLSRSDDKNSGIPCAILEYTLHNTSSHTVEYEILLPSFPSSSRMQQGGIGSRNTVIPNRGVFLHQFGEAKCRRLRKRFSDRRRHQAAYQGHVGCAVQAGNSTRCPHSGAKFSTGRFTANDGSNEIDTSGRNGCSILLEGTIAPGELHTHPSPSLGISQIVTSKLEGFRFLTT